MIRDQVTECPKGIFSKKLPKAGLLSRNSRMFSEQHTMEFPFSDFGSIAQHVSAIENLKYIILIIPGPGVRGFTKPLNSNPTSIAMSTYVGNCPF
jgi:hypothetical protein